MTTPNILISHRWSYSDDYYKLIEKLDSYGIDYLNYSVPEHDPLDINHVAQIKNKRKDSGLGLTETENGLMCWYETAAEVRETRFREDGSIRFGGYYFAAARSYTATI
jgi:hypothetical protein